MVLPPAPPSEKNANVVVVDQSCCSSLPHALPKKISDIDEEQKHEGSEEMMSDNENPRRRWASTPPRMQIAGEQMLHIEKCDEIFIYVLDIVDPLGKPASPSSLSESSDHDVSREVERREPIKQETEKRKRRGDKKIRGKRRRRRCGKKGGRKRKGRKGRKF